MAHVFPLGFLSYSWSQGMKKSEISVKITGSLEDDLRKNILRHTFIAKRSELDSHLHTWDFSSERNAIIFQRKNLGPLVCHMNI